MKRRRAPKAPLSADMASMFGIREHGGHDVTSHRAPLAGEHTRLHSCANCPYAANSPWREDNRPQTAVMTVNYRPTAWVVLDKASEFTGRSVDSFRRLIREGRLVEDIHWKWSPDNRQHINLDAYDEWVAKSNSKGSTRGRRRSVSISDGMAAVFANA